MGHIKQRWTEYTEATSIHGIADLEKSPSLHRRVFWLIVLIAAACVGIYEINHIFIDYHNSPIITTYELVSKITHKFPEIELCLPSSINVRSVKVRNLSKILLNYMKLALNRDMRSPRAFKEADPLHFTVALQPTRQKALQEMDKLSVKFDLDNQEKILAFARIEADISEALHINDLIATKTVDTMEKMKMIEKAIRNSQQTGTTASTTSDAIPDANLGPEIQPTPQSTMPRTNHTLSKVTTVPPEASSSVMDTTPNPSASAIPTTSTTLPPEASSSVMDTTPNPSASAIPTTSTTLPPEASSSVMDTTPKPSASTIPTTSTTLPPEASSPVIDTTPKPTTTTIPTPSTTLPPETSSPVIDSIPKPSVSSTPTTSTTVTLKTSAITTPSTSGTPTTITTTIPMTSTMHDYDADVVKIQEHFMVNREVLIGYLDLSPGATSQEIVSAAKIMKESENRQKRQVSCNILSVLKEETGFDENVILINEYLNRTVKNCEDPTHVIEDILESYRNEIPEVDVFAKHYAFIEKWNVLNKETGHLDIENLYYSVGYQVINIFGKSMYATNNRLNTADCIKPVFDPLYGKCYLIKVAQEQRVGGAGLTVHMNDLVHEGIYVRIGKDFNPISGQTFRIPSGMNAQMTLRSTHYLLSQSEKYGKCQRDINRNFTTYPYSDTVCRTECRMTAVKKDCGCSMVIPKGFLKQGIQYKSCVESGNLACELKPRALEKSCIEMCKPACEYWDYSPVVTFANKYSNSYKRYVTDTYKQPIGNGNHGLRLAIFYSDMEYMKVEQKDAISVHGLISQVGGQMGLFLGASVLSLTQIVVYCIFCICGKKQRVNHQPDEPKYQYRP